ncbi:hypothetical protein AALP_AA5G217300 [Arabis alpina]|uniref:J domain-containing protein n=1 Tax=Arabis alpina TaxID=50452 RepID=A0A087GYL7_ARAAL|nr:hypothetical protein AALP_AA5G217300 [Arabis alpina]
MDGNKDDALKCLKICKDAMKAGDRPRALKFLSKARRLDPDLQVADLLSEINNQSEESRKSSGSTTGAKDSPDSSDRPSLRQRGSSTTSSPSSSSKSYTEEQISIVRKIKSKKDYYEILGLETNCSVDDIRKAYRKLSLKVHPDKNQAPGSEEAFKSVSKAFQCLSNEEARKKYDVSGSDEPVYQPRRSARSNGFNGGGYYYEDEFDPNEIFRSFFGGGGMPQATAQFRSFNFGASRHRAANHNHQANDAGFNARILLQLLPVLLILLLNFMPSSQPVYQLSSTYPYNYKFTTQKGVNYFVRSSKFEQDYPRESEERHTLEEQVERDYVSILSQNCRYELQRQQWGFVRETPHCDMMRRFEATAA